MRSSLVRTSLLAALVGATYLTGLPLVAQDPESPPKESGGWRKFGEPAPAEESAGRPNDDAPPPRARELPAQLTLPAGTWITVRVNEPLSSERNLAGDAFSATLAQPIVADGYVVARRGQTAGGRVVETQKAGRVKGTSKLGIELTELTLVDGQQMPIVTQLVEYAGGTSKGRDATAIGTTTAAGAAIGGAASGGAAAGIGAGAGAAAAVIGVLLTRGRATEIYPEATLTFRTTAPVTISTERGPQAFTAVRQEDYESRQLQRRVSRPAPPPPFLWSGYYWPYYYSPFWHGVSFYYFSGPRYYRGRGFRRW